MQPIDEEGAVLFGTPRDWFTKTRRYGTLSGEIIALNHCVILGIVVLVVYARVLPHSSPQLLLESR